MKVKIKIISYSNNLLFNLLSHDNFYKLRTLQKNKNINEIDIIYVLRTYFVLQTKVLFDHYIDYIFCTHITKFIRIYIYI